MYLNRIVRLAGNIPQVRRPLVTASVVSIRQFNSTRYVNGKKAKKSKGSGGGAAAQQAEAPVDSNILDAQAIKKEIKHVEDKFKDTVQQFLIKSSEAKQGKASTSKIGQMRIPLSNNEDAQELRAIANIQIKNNNRTIVLTVFDPKHVKYIQSGVLAELGVTPQVDSRNAQVVNITLPTKTADAKKQLAKQIKQEYDHFRNSPSKHSLTYLREEVMRHIKKSHLGKSISDDENRTFNQNVEKLFKKYNDDLTTQFKKIEKTVLNE